MFSFTVRAANGGLLYILLPVTFGCTAATCDRASTFCCGMAPSTVFFHSALGLVCAGLCYI